MGELAHFPTPAKRRGAGESSAADAVSTEAAGAGAAAPRPQPAGPPEGAPERRSPGQPAPPPVPVDEAVHLVPEPYSAPVREEEVELLPALKPWVWALVAVLVLWVLISFPVWWDATAELERLVDQALELAPPTASPGARP